MVTTFHVPRTTLMMLVYEVATSEPIMDAYQSAIDEKYRFLSFGDAMICSRVANAETSIIKVERGTWKLVTIVSTTWNVEPGIK